MTQRSSSSSSIRRPADCRDMSEVRVEIDRLDNLLVPLIAERTGYVARAAELKPNRAAIVDEARIQQIVDKVRAQTQTAGGDPDLIEAIYRAMIDAFIAFEEKSFDRAGRK